MQIKQLLFKAIEILNENKIEDGAFKAKELMQYVLQKDRTYLIVHGKEELDKQEEIRYTAYVQEVLQGKPLQYITHKQEFMGLSFFVDEHVLIPQPDTETLVEEAIQEIEKYLFMHKKEQSGTIRILDLCTGSGAIAVSLARYIKNNRMLPQYKNVQFEIIATDISKKALEVAEKNAKSHDVQIQLLQSNLFEKIDLEENNEKENSKTKKFDMIVSNPPYIETETIKTLSEEVKQEPHLALDGGKDGLKFYRIIAKEGEKYLKKKRNDFSRNWI